MPNKDGIVPAGSNSGPAMKVSPPGSFSFVAEDWQKYKTRFIRYMSISGNDQAPDEDKVNCLIYCMGDKAEDVIIQFGGNLTYKELVEKLDEFYSPKKNIVYERYKFNARVQKEGERVEEYITEIHRLAQNCNYGNLKEELIRDQIIIGIRNKSTSERMLLKSDLSLEEATLMCRQAEIQEEESKLMRGENELDLNRLKNEKYTKNKCWYCGLERHQRDKCPASKATCHKCQRQGHFAKQCRSKTVRRVEEQRVIEAHEVSFCEKRDIYTVEVNVFYNNQFKDKVKFLIDTGADISAISENIANKFNLRCLQCTDSVKGPDGAKLDVIGMVNLKLIYKNNSYDGKVYIIKGLKTPLLGRPSIDSMNLISVCSVSKSEVSSDACATGVWVEKEFPNIFNDLGVFKDEFHITLIDKPEPYVQASPRNVSIPLLPKVKEELQRLETLGIISPIEEPTDFVSPIVVVFKNDKVRICGDYTQVNKNILRPIYPIPKIENTLAKLKGAKYFSKIDATSGFHQIKLDTESRKLTTIITPFGRYVYNRLPFGLNCAPEYFSMKFTNLFKDLKVAIHMDDILIFEQSEVEHNRILGEVLKRLHNEGLTINKNKCLFGVREISYLGHTINEKGINIDPERIQAIQSFKSPSNKKELLQFLGMINFVGRFLSNKSHILEPLHILLKENQIFTWGHCQEIAFNQIKEKLQRPPTLAHYDPSSKIIVSADSSSYGLGAALIQEDIEGRRSVVMYASRTLTDTERHYAQIEKESLALVWAAEKFRDYIIGIHVQLETDHKPLLQILQTKPLDDLSPRLLRFRLKLTRFDYHVKYIPGKDQLVADALSRQPMTNCKEALSEQDQELDINMLVSEALPNESLLHIKIEQDKCNICKKLKEFTIKGWPNKSQLGSFQNYYQYKNNFSIETDILLYNSRIVIPNNMQKEILNKIHEGHLGISKCRERAKQAVWWLGLSKQIEEKVKTCHKCIEIYKNHKEKMITEPPPDRPWQKLGLDLFKFNNNWYLVIIDYYSRFLEIAKLKDLTEDTVIAECKKVFSRYGIPEIVRSDCGSQFKSKFESFSKEYGFTSVTSSPYFSQSNGLAESGVKIAKSLLAKNDDIYMALLIYRNSPTEFGYSPAELLFNRKLRDNLPIIASKLNKPVKVNEDFKDFKLEKKCKDAYYYNKRHRASNLQDLSVNDQVWVCDLKTYGTVIAKCKEPRSFKIETPKGIYRRNRWHLVKAPLQESSMQRDVICDDVHIYDDCQTSLPTSLSGCQSTQDTENTCTSEEVSDLNNDECILPKRLVKRPQYLNDYVTD